MNIAAADLNLFVVLHAVLEEGSATRAAERLHVSQSAISNALARLRDALGDPLVVRTGRGLTPTPRGLELKPSVATIVNEAATLLASVKPFRPAETTRTFTLAAADNHQVREVPEVARRFLKQLPRAQLRTVSPDYLAATDGLTSGTVDACFAPHQIVSSQPGLHARPLFEEHAAFVVRRDHPVVAESLTPRLYSTVQHIGIEIALGRPGEGARVLHDDLKRQGLAAPPPLSVPSFVTALLIAAKTDCVASVPLRVAELYCAYLPLRIVRATFPTPTLITSLLWHERTHEDAGCAFFRELIVEAVAVPAGAGERRGGQRGARGSRRRGFRRA
jgi:DNA-binding transcriptional LysR family regulator